MKIALRTSLSGVAALVPAMIASDTAHAVYTGLTVELHTTVVAGPNTRSVYRVYANFDNPTDLMLAYFGGTADPFVIESRNFDDTAPGGNFFNPGGGSAGNTAPTLAQINGSSKTPAIPNIQWGTFATIGVSIAEQGSGPIPQIPFPDQTITNPGFGNFIDGNIFVSAGIVTAPPVAIPGNGQGLAGYTPDGDLQLRVLLMQLTVNLGENVRGEIDLDYVPAGSSNAVVLEDQTFNSIPAPGCLALLAVALATPRGRRRTEKPAR